MPFTADSLDCIPVPKEARIKVVGVGGGGNNAISRMIASHLEGVQFLSLNTDAQTLRASTADVKLQLGARLTHGLGAGGDPEIGLRAAMDESEQIVEAIEGAEMIFVTAGLGGGTGTGAAPVVASLARQTGALTVAVVTLPFGFEGRSRMKRAERGLEQLLDEVDTLVVIPNDRLLAVANDPCFFKSFHLADDVLRQAVQGITDIITIPGVINRDLADIRTIMTDMGYAVMGTATRSGSTRAADATVAAMTSPLFDGGTIQGARGILINITGSTSLKLREVDEASTLIRTMAHEDANILFGAVLDERMGDEVKITLIATGFQSRRSPSRRKVHRDPAEDVTPNTDGTRPPIKIEDFNARVSKNPAETAPLFEEPPSVVAAPEPKEAIRERPELAPFETLRREALAGYAAVSEKKDVEDIVEEPGSFAAILGSRVKLAFGQPRDPSPSRSEGSE